MSLAQWVDLHRHGDDRGSLIAIEGMRDVPFAIQRVYYIFGTAPSVARGFHAHKALQQVAVCAAGKCRMVLDDGRVRESIWLDSPQRGLLINRLLWHEMHDFSTNCVLLVFASARYNEDDYIRDYSVFSRLSKS